MALFSNILWGKLAKKWEKRHQDLLPLSEADAFILNELVELKKMFPEIDHYCRVVGADMTVKEALFIIKSSHLWSKKDALCSFNNKT